MEEKGREIYLAWISVVCIAILAYFNIIDGTTAIGAIIFLNTGTTLSRSILKSKDISINKDD